MVAQQAIKKDNEKGNMRIINPIAFSSDPQHFQELATNEQIAEVYNIK